MKIALKIILISVLSFFIFGCATTDNLGDLSKRFDEIKKIETLL